MSKDSGDKGDKGEKVDKAGATGRWRARLTRTLAATLNDRNQLLEMLSDAQQRGLIDADAYAMVEGVLGVEALQVRDIMIPRPQMICLHRDDPAPRILAAVAESGHSRFPVLDTDRDDVVGILLAKDLLRLYASGTQDKFDMREYLRPAVFIPESKRLNVLLKEFRGNRNHMAIVVDEYASVAGLVTIENVIEQIIGDIDDEFDVEDDQNIRREGERQFSVRGSTRIDEFNQYFSAEMPEDEFDTMAGLVTKQLGRLPRRNEVIQIGEFEVRVVRTNGRRIDGLRVIIPNTFNPSDPSG